MHKNVQELLPAKLAIITFAKMKKPKGIHLQLDNKTALSAVANLGKTENPKLTQISKNMWDFHNQQKKLVTLEHIPSARIYIADLEFRQTKGLQ